MPETVPVTLELDPKTAAALGDPGTRARVERLIQRTVHLTGVDQLFAAIDALSADARRRGLTDEILEAELEACNAERRERQASQGGPMPDMVEIPIPIEAGAVATLADARTRAAMGRLVSRVLRPRSGPSELAQAIADVKAEAWDASLTEANIDAELEAYNAERRGNSAT